MSDQYRDGSAGLTAASIREAWASMPSKLEVPRPRNMHNGVFLTDREIVALVYGEDAAIRWDNNYQDPTS